MNVSDAIHVSPGWGPGAYGIWGLIVIQLFLILGVAIKKLPDIITAWVASRRQDADEEEKGIAREEAGKESLSKRVADLEARMISLNASIGFLMNAAITSTNALEAVSPDNVAIKQSRELIGMAAAALGGNDPFSQALTKLGNLPGLGERN